MKAQNNYEGGTSSLRQQKGAFTKQWRNWLWSKPGIISLSISLIFCDF